jgi:hypothetical protein
MKILYPGNLTRKTFFYFTTLFYIGQASAQSYYPGGLGNSNLVFWLDAGKSSSITKNGSNQVSQWSDLSGNGYNFTQATTTNEPTYSSTGGPNSRPALTFDTTKHQHLALASLPSSISFTGGVTTFAQVAFSQASSWGWPRIYDLGNGTASDNICFGRYKGSSMQNLYYEGWNGGSGDETYTTANPVSNGGSNIYEAIQSAGSTGTLASVAMYVAGAAQATGGQAGSAKTWVPNAITRTSNYVGRSNWSADDYFRGTMSEILLYNTAFNTTQRVIIENYLSAEWGHSISVTKYTPPTTSTYITNLVGIGYTSSTDYFLTNPSGSTDGLGFSSGTSGTSFLNSAGYMMAAHNGQSNTAITGGLGGIVSSSSTTYWNRSWYLQQTGGNSSGTVTLNFNFSDYNGTTPPAGYTFRLLYNSSDGTFASGTNTLTGTSGTVSGNIVSFSLTASSLSAGYYTIIYSSSVLPIVLSEFTAARQGSGTLLQWTVAQESNMDHYEIQRGATAGDLATVGSVTASNAGAYSFTDGAPVTGVNYYRLKIVDRDGGTTYSNVVLVDFESTVASGVIIYPNPVADQLHITLADAANGASILLLNSLGQTVKTVRASSAGSVNIPVGDLVKGIYIVEVQTGATKYVRKIMKN